MVSKHIMKAVAARMVRSLDSLSFEVDRPLTPEAPAAPQLNRVEQDPTRPRTSSRQDAG